jgi:hypothetical protein
MKLLLFFISTIMLASCSIDNEQQPIQKNKSVTYPDTYEASAVSIYCNDTITTPFGISRYAETQVTSATKFGTRYEFIGISYAAGQTCNFKFSLYDRWGGTLNPGDQVRVDTNNTYVTMYTPSIGHDSTYSLAFSTAQVQSITITNDTTRVDFYVCLYPLNGLAFNAFAKFKQ